MTRRPFPLSITIGPLKPEILRTELHAATLTVADIKRRALPTPK